MLSTAFSLAIVGYVINLAMGRTLAAKHGYDVDPNQVQIMALALVDLFLYTVHIYIIHECALAQLAIALILYTYKWPQL